MRHWPDDVLDEVVAVARLRRYDKRTPLMVGERSRREVLVVASGRLAVEGVDAAGVRFVLSLHGPGEIVSLVRMLGNSSIAKSSPVSPMMALTMSVAMPVSWPFST